MAQEEATFHGNETLIENLAVQGNNWTNEDKGI
jgi:hypothetical protein